MESMKVPGGFLNTRPTEVTTGNGPVRVGVDATGIRHLLVPAATRDDIVTDRRSRGVVVVAQSLEVDGEERVFADLVCVDPTLTHLYTRLAQDVSEAITVDSEQASAIPARILDQWRDLLASARRQLDTETLVGLHGELHVIRHGLRTGGPGIVAAWTGPQGSPHDFSRPGWALEVKATKAREGRRVTIHGLEQLDTLLGTSLHLAFVRLLPDPDGLTLHALVEAALAEGAPRRQLLEGLLQVGYQHGRAEEEALRLALREFSYYEVDERFPAITASTFPSGPPRGIESVHYVVDLHAAHGPLSEEDSDALLRRLSST